jgi:hypothetical protein
LLTQAYDKVDAAVSEKVLQSERRSRLHLKAEKEKHAAILQAARKQWRLLHSHTNNSKGAAEARKRINQKIKLISETRVTAADI